MSKLQASTGMTFESTKTYTHSQGLSCCFRQWRATESHCRFLHGYALQVTITFRSQKLDDRNWVMDFGGLKPVKQWLEETFDHKTLVARDDPERQTLEALAAPDYDREGEPGQPIIDLVVVEHVGCEAFAKMIYDHVMWWLTEEKIPWVYVECVEVREHPGNSARYRRL